MIKIIPNNCQLLSKLLLLCFLAGLCTASDGTSSLVSSAAFVRQLSNETNYTATETTEATIFNGSPDEMPWPTWWIAFSIILWIMHGIVVIFDIFFLTAILSNRMVRDVSYNIYLMFLILPDLLINAAQTWYPMIWVTVLYLFTSFWLNSLVAAKIYQLLVKSFNRVKISPASLKVVYTQCICVYLVAIVFAIACSVDFFWSPMSLQSSCHLIMFQSAKDGLFSTEATLIMLAILWGFPSIYVLYIRWDIWNSGYLPPSGRTRRMLSLYLFRIILNLTGSNIPIVVLLQVLSSVISPSNTTAKFFLLGIIRFLIIFQAAVNLVVALQKRDVDIAMQQSLTKIRLFGVSVWNRIFTCCGVRTPPRPPIINKWDVSTTRRVSSFGLTVEKQVWDFFELCDSDNPNALQLEEAGTETHEDIVTASENLEIAWGKGNVRTANITIADCSSSFLQGELKSNEAVHADMMGPDFRFSTEDIVIASEDIEDTWGEESIRTANTKISDYSSSFLKGEPK